MSDPKPISTSDTDEKRGTERAPTGDKANPENHQDEMSERLDEALEETFPSSDPVSVKITK
ncbi:hypothetical protein MBUL_02582 [Methylobacterium bullatum]|uniref:Uncharacterized protein n=1 Tax=Methylobacterium bullatum TaxID=570505 RepID=A0A679J6R2_9HYPH|nr:hypothetical protein MBUL_02582 [Methylobacterium bullatum]